MKFNSEFATVGPKGEIVVPARIRRKLSMKPGTPVMIQEDHGQIVIVMCGTDAYIDAVRGMFGDTTPLIKQLRRDHRLEDKRRDLRWKRQGFLE